MSHQDLPSATDIFDLPTFSAKDLAYCSTEEARAILPLDLARKHKVLPLSLIKQGSRTFLYAAAADPGPVLEKEIRFLCDATVRLTKVPPELVLDSITRAYCGSNELLSRALDRLSTIKVVPKQPREPEFTPTGDAALFLDTVMGFACARGASDVHFCPVVDGALIKLRIDGELLIQNQRSYPKPIHEQLVSRIKVLSKLDISKRAVPQDGAFMFRFQEGARPARVSVMPTIHGESVVLRLLHSKALPALDTLGLPPRFTTLLSGTLRKSAGLILLTGPTGSGKTTTLYAAVRELAELGLNIVTVEDPVEVPIPGVTQVHISPDTGFDYPAAIRAVLRHDPDALLIGEIRDRESAAIALEAAMTGHLTLSSVHAASAAEVFDRFEGLGIERARVSEAILMVLNQRLVPSLCERCRVVDLNDSAHFKRTVHRPVGCAACDYSGFDGRTILCEAINISTHEARQAVRRASSRGELLSNLPGAGYLSWLISLEHQLSRGGISALQFNDFLDRDMEPS